MTTVEVSQRIPSFSLPATSDKMIKLAELKGQYVVLYFYPKDSTPGCTIEGRDFRDNYSKFKKLNAEVFGVSRDNLKSHERFKEKQQFPFELISDSEEELCNVFDVIKQKKMFGKKVRGIQRSTFIIDPNGKLVHEWRKVAVKGHVDEVLQVVKELSQ